MYKSDKDFNCYFLEEEKTFFSLCRIASYGCEYIDMGLSFDLLVIIKPLLHCFILFICNSYLVYQSNHVVI